ncbi:MAG: pyruvate carboxyltransferase, partial [Cryptosporangiaceae bacterium]|nr:pyruvate carboxyltransferase [Cryptosporangiaceae bacterium]
MSTELPSSVRIVEVGLRDGLQAVSAPLRTEDKVDLVHRLVDAGVREIEAVSFAHPKVLPQLADAAEVMAAVPRRG